MLLGVCCPGPDAFPYPPLRELFPAGGSALQPPPPSQTCCKPSSPHKTIPGGDLGILLETHGAASRSPGALFPMAWMNLSVTWGLSSFTACCQGLEPHSHRSEIQGIWPGPPSNPLLPWQAVCPQVSCQSHQQHMSRLPEGKQDPSCASSTPQDPGGRELGELWQPGN